MELREFHNGIRVLYNIEGWDLQAAGMDKDEVETFLDNPIQYFIRCDDKTAHKIFDIIDAANAKRKAVRAA
jgi:hypothetical protein